MSNLYIGKNRFDRFDISPIRDPMGRGINGYHGILSNIIGFILEKIFHKTVSFEWQNGSKTSIYYFNCKSFGKWYHLVHPDHPSIKSFEENTHDPAWIKKAIDTLCNPKEVVKVSFKTSLFPPSFKVNYDRKTIVEDVK